MLVQTVCKGYQQAIKVTASEESVMRVVNIVTTLLACLLYQIGAKSLF